MEKVIVYKNVFSRDSLMETTFDVYLENPLSIYGNFGANVGILETIRKTKDKEERNILKRNNLPTMDLSQSGILAIDIDNISDSPLIKENIVLKLKKNDYCFLIKESVSGNIVAFFKYDCSVKDYPFLYYKLYLELTILLGVNIDFLPEIGRLRYVDLNDILYINKNCETLTEILNVGVLPQIKTSITIKNARNVRYGSL